MSGARPPGAPPPRPPPPRAVAEDVLELEKWIAPDCAILEHLRAEPKVAAWLKLLEAERAYRELREAGVGSVEAQRLLAARLGVSDRTLRLWGLNG